METFIMLTRVSEESVHQPRSFETLERRAMDHIRKECPGVSWVANYAVAGPFDYVDIFTAPDVHSAMRVSLLIRAHGRSHSELWPALPWDDFRKMVHGLPEAAG